MIDRKMAALALAALTAAGCSNGGVTPANGPAAFPAGRSAANRVKGRARIEIRIPKRERRGRYVSPSTKSLTVTANGAKIGTFNVTPGTKGCTVNAGATQCSITLGVPTGNVIFAVSTYSAANGTGSLLSSGFVAAKVAAGTLATIPLVLEGTVASIVVSLGNEHLDAGSAGTTAVYVTALDAAGNAIVGSANYGVPIQLTNSDSSGTVTLSPASVTSPGTQVKLTYNGASIFSATIGASASGVSTIVPATFSPIPVVYKVFPAPAGLAHGTGTYAITNGPDGNIWYTTKTTNAIVTLAPATGAETTYVAGTAPGLTAGGIFLGITSGPDGNLWFTDNHNKTIGRITPGGTITEFAAPGGICPNRIVAGPSGDGGLWFTSTCNAFIGHINATTTVANAYALAGGGSNYNGIIVGKDGRLYIADKGQKAIGQVTISGGTVSSYAEVAIPANPLTATANASLTGLTQTADGRIWFGDSSCNPGTLGSIQIASTFSASVVNEFQPSVGCSYPSYMLPTANGAAFFLAIWNYPAIALVTPAAATASATSPTYDYISLQAYTPSNVFSQVYDVAQGSNGNIFGTVNSGGSSNAADYIVEMAY